MKENNKWRGKTCGGPGDPCSPAPLRFYIQSDITKKNTLNNIKHTPILWKGFGTKALLLNSLFPFPIFFTNNYKPIKKDLFIIPNIKTSKKYLLTKKNNNHL